MNKTELVQHMAEGQKRVHDNDYEPLIADINDEIKHLTLDTLTELYKHVKFLRKRSQPLPAEITDGQTGAFDGTQANPVSFKNNIVSDICLMLVEDMAFDTLLTWAETLAVPHDVRFWLDDEWPDKEDALRVAVAEAMERWENERDTFR